MATVVNPALPYTTKLAGKFEVGSIIEVKGVVNEDANRFTINFRTSKRDVAFHFNPRFTDDVVVMNTKREGTWQTEERVPCCALQRGKEFDLIIMVESEKFMVSLNGEHYCHFAHRLDRDDIELLEVLGDAQVSQIRDGTVFMTRAAINQLTVPVAINIPGGFTAEKMLFVYGALTGKGFSINLQSGSEPFRNTALHVNPRLWQNAIVINDCVEGQWGFEVTQPFDLQEGWTFAIEIVSHGDVFEIRVNGKELPNFQHRHLDIRPMESIDNLFIVGDVEIHQLRI